MEKYCKYCDRTLPINRFQKAVTCKDGRRNKCKDCRNKDARNRHKIVCKNCNKEGRSERKDAKFCSNECKWEYNRNGKKVPCSYCGKELYRTSHFLKEDKNHYCDRSCTSKHKSILFKGRKSPLYKRVSTKCSGCGDEIEVVPSIFEMQEHHFCDYQCYKKNIGKFFRGENHSRYNKYLSDEDREANRDYFEYNKWRLDVFKRDEYTCQNCGDKRGGNLVAHHILNYSEHVSLRTDINNGITLCSKCHKEFHDYYGYSGNNLKQLNYFLSKTKTT